MGRYKVYFIIDGERVFGSESHYDINANKITPMHFQTDKVKDEACKLFSKPTMLVDK